GMRIEITAHVRDGLYPLASALLIEGGFFHALCPIRSPRRLSHHLPRHDHHDNPTLRCLPRVARRERGDRAVAAVWPEHRLRTTLRRTARRGDDRGGAGNRG